MPGHKAVAKTGAPSERLCGFCVLLTSAERERLHGKAAAAGMSANRYLKTVMAAVEEGRTAIAGKDAVDALAESNYQLAWIGRNLSQIARTLNATQEKGVDAYGERLHEAIVLLREHLAHAAAVLADVECTRTSRRNRSARAAGFPNPEP